MVGGAWGGRSDKDGIEAITNPSQNLSNTPVEVLELQHPVRVKEYALVPDSCGPGRNRGGLGISRSFRVLADERSEEHTSELQSLMRISYAVFCLKKKKNINIHIN